MATTTRRLSSGDISIVALIVLALVALSLIVTNVVFTSYAAMREMRDARAEKLVVRYDTQSGNATVVNIGAVTVRVVSVWVINSTGHFRQAVGASEGTLMPGGRLVVTAPRASQLRVVTERGRVFAWSA